MFSFTTLYSLIVKKYFGYYLLQKSREARFAERLK